MNMSGTDPSPVPACSFCGASPDVADRIFAASTAAVCDSCIRSLAAAAAKEMPPSKSPVAALVGRWIGKGGDPLSVSLHFTEGGLLFSTMSDGSNATEKLLRYSLNGAILFTVEMVPCATASEDRVEVSGDVLTIRTNRSTSVFHRDKSGMVPARPGARGTLDA